MYEVLIATGFGDKAGTDNTVHFSLVYGGGKVSQSLRPGSNEHNNHSDAFQKGRLDICRDCDFKDASGQSIKADDITAVDIYFEGEKWHLDKVWITNVDTGATVASTGDVWIGSETDATQHHRLPLAPETAPDATGSKSALFDLTVKTVDANNDHKHPGTNDTVHFKLFGADGRSSECHRAKRKGNQYQEGATDHIQGFLTSFWVKGLKLFDDDHVDIDIDSEPFRIDTRIFKVLIVKEGSDGWRPEWLDVTATRGGQPTNHFRIKEQMPEGSDGALEGDYKWCCVTAD